MSKNTQLEIRFNKENFIALLNDRTDSRNKIFSLQSEIKNLNADIKEQGKEITLLHSQLHSKKKDNSTD